MIYPELEFNWHTHPDLADNIWHAQMAGWPRVLTYNGPDIKLRRANRNAAMHFEYEGSRYEIPLRLQSRDEYPFACTEEGGGVWVGHIPGRENSAQGGLIAAFLYRHKIVSGKGERSKFLVTVINHPRGLVNPGIRFSDRQLFKEDHIRTVPALPGVYIIYDLCGPIYVGRSRVSVRDSLTSHLTGKGNKNIAMAKRVGAQGSLSFRFLCGIEFVERAKASLLLVLGPIKFDNLLKKTDPADW